MGALPAFFVDPTNPLFISITSSVQAEGNIVCQQIENIRWLSRAAYTVWFGTLWGYVVFGHASPDRALNTGLFYVLLISGFIGALLIVLKNSKIAPRPLKLKCTFADGLISVILLALIYTIPDVIGLIKAAIILIVICIYFVIYYRFCDKTIFGD